MKRNLVVVVVVLLVSATAFAAAPNMAWRQVIPAAVSAPGAEGSYWRTDLNLFNPTDREAEITLSFYASGGSGPGAAVSVTLDEALAPHQALSLEDVLGAHFPGESLGALVVQARDEAGQWVDVVAASRTWTPTASGGGSYGQGIPGVAWREDGDLAQPERILVELESSELFRSNLGIVNLSETLEERFTIEFHGVDGNQNGVWYEDVGPRSHVQINNFLDRIGRGGGGKGTVVVRLTDVNDLAPEGNELSSAADFVVYASKVDQTTNDPFYISEQIDERRSGTDRYQLVPVAASAGGEQGSYWRTDLTIHYPGDEPLVVAFVELIPTAGQELEGDPPRFTQFLLSGQTVTIEDVLGSKFPDYPVAALRVRSSGTAENLMVSTRTWTPDAEGGGTLGQGISGVAMSAGAVAQVVPGLQSSESFRSNLGLLNPSTNLRETFEVEVFDGEGQSRGTRSYIMQPWSHRQINGILEEFGVTGSGYSAVVRMSASENLFSDPDGSWDPFLFAYGSVVDQMTNDPTYVEGYALREEREGGAGDWYDFELEAPWYLCPEEPWPAEATVVRAFDQAYHYFGGGDNFRSIAREVEFPDEGEWNQVGLYLHLECPEGGNCDDWDRTGSLQLVLNPEDPEEEWEYLEIMRHITPYKIHMCEYVDVTALASLLKGTQTLVSWIDTWVGPGHGQGEGWRISFDFVFYPGERRAADEVLNIWGRRSLTVGYPGSENNVDVQTEPVTVSIPADANRVEARLISTGHAFGNTLNCAEFCPMRQDLYVDGQRSSVLPWRTDCEHNPHSPQSGTWQYDRNGWCPGAIVVGDTIDITDLVTPGEDAEIDFDIRLMDGEVYENTDPAEYDPFEWVSLQLYVYR